MKKFLAIVLSAVMICSLFGCAKPAQETEAETKAETTKETEAETEAEVVYTESIPLGGNAGEFELAEVGFGTYKEVTPYGDFIFSDVDEERMYVDESCDTPYIVVYRWAKNGQTLEEAVKEEADLYANGLYNMVEDQFANAELEGYFVGTTSKEGKFLYFQTVMLEDGDDIVEIDFLCKAEEVQLGDSDKWIWVPAGGQDVMTQDDIDHGTFYSVDYDPAYYFPSIWGGTVDYSYEYAKWYWSDNYEGEFPYTEEENEQYWADFEEGADQEDIYNTFGFHTVYNYAGEKDGCTYEINAMDCDAGDRFAEEICIYYDGEIYDIWTFTYDLTWTSFIGKQIADSIHTIEGSGAQKYVDSIPLGGSLGDYHIAGDAYGIYKEIDISTIYDGEVSDIYEEVHVYRSKGSDTPCMITSRWASDGKTLEDTIKEFAAAYSDDYYVYFDTIEEVDSGAAAYYYCSSYQLEDKFYYCDSLIFQDGDEFVSLDWYTATEEIALSDSGYYMWVPTGYLDIIEEIEAEYGVIFSGEYEDSYDLPWIWVVKLDDTYEQACNIWGDGDLTMTEEEYMKFVEAEEWTDELNEEFYGAFNETIVFSEECEVNGLRYFITGYTQNDDGTFNEDVYVDLGGYTYEFWLGYPEGHPEYYGDVIMASIHQK